MQIDFRYENVLLASKANCIKEQHSWFGCDLDGVGPANYRTCVRNLRTFSQTDGWPTGPTTPPIDDLLDFLPSWRLRIYKKIKLKYQT